MNHTLQRSTVKSPIGDIEIFTLTNKQGASVTLSSLGAGVISVRVPDREGRLDEVSLTYASPVDFIDDAPASGKTLGRYANRIAGAKFRLESRNVWLEANDGPNALNGGRNGFQNRLWQVESAGNSEVIFRRVSEDGEEGYPGRLVVDVRYRWDNKCRLSVSYEAYTDITTIINLTNNCYWNLRGTSSGSSGMLEQELSLKAVLYLPCNQQLIPLGPMERVMGTPMDFLKPKPIGQDINAPFDVLALDNGYNTPFMLDRWWPGTFIEEAARLYDPVSGRCLTIGTDQPSALLYTGNHLEAAPPAPDGTPRQPHDFVSITMQGVPDAPNRPHFPHQTLFPEDVYRRRIVYTFSVL